MYDLVPKESTLIVSTCEELVAEPIYHVSSAKATS